MIKKPHQTDKPSAFKPRKNNDNDSAKKLDNDVLNKKIDLDMTFGRKPDQGNNDYDNDNPLLKKPVDKILPDGINDNGQETTKKPTIVHLVDPNKPRSQFITAPHVKLPESQIGSPSKAKDAQHALDQQFDNDLLAQQKRNARKESADDSILEKTGETHEPQIGLQGPDGQGKKVLFQPQAADKLPPGIIDWN